MIPIDLPDDGMRLDRTGQIGPYRFVTLSNPELIADTIAVRVHRNLIRNANERLFS